MDHWYHWRKKVVPKKNTIGRACEISLGPVGPLIPFKNYIHTPEIFGLSFVYVYMCSISDYPTEVVPLVPEPPDSEKVVPRMVPEWDKWSHDQKIYKVSHQLSNQ